MSENIIWDKDRAMTLVGGNETLFLENVRAFLLDSTRIEEGMQSAYLQKNTKEYGIYAHALKGSLALLGFTAMSDCARELEFAAKDNCLTLIEQKHQAYWEDYVQTKSMLIKYLADAEKKVKESQSVTKGSREDFFKDCEQIYVFAKDMDTIPLLDTIERMINTDYEMDDANYFCSTIYDLAQSFEYELIYEKVQIVLQKR